METIECRGRRLGVDRRRLSLPTEFSERRSPEDRRGGVERRSCLERRSSKGFRSLVGLDRRKCFSKKKLVI